MTYSDVVADDIKSGCFLDNEVEALVSDAEIGAEGKSSGATFDVHAVWETVVGNVLEVGELGVFFLFFSASSLSSRRRFV